MQIDHIGYAVKNIKLSINAFEKLGFEFGEIIDDINRNVKIAFGNNQVYRIELISCLNENEKSPVDTVLLKMGPTPYHICYKTENLDCALVELEKEGYRIISLPLEAVAFNGKRVCFLIKEDVGIIEVVEV